MSEKKLCKKCKCLLKSELFRDGETCKYCREKNIIEKLAKKGGRKELKKSPDYLYVFKNLTSGRKNCFVSKMMYDELCMIDKRFKRIEKKPNTPTFDWEQDGYMLFGNGEYWLNID